MIRPHGVSGPATLTLDTLIGIGYYPNGGAGFEALGPDEGVFVQIGTFSDPQLNTLLNGL